MIDAIVPEPLGGAHRETAVVISAVGDAIEKELAALRPLSGVELRQARREKFLAMGQVGLA